MHLIYEKRSKVDVCLVRVRGCGCFEVVLGRYGVMASTSYRFLSIPTGPFVFRFSLWMILSPF